MADIKRTVWRVADRSKRAVERHRLVRRGASERRRRQLIADGYTGTRRLDLGSGPYPTRNYIHVDSDPTATDLDLLAEAWDIPLPDNWAEEVHAVHVLEHIPPARLGATLREWRRVLRPGGLLDVHVPNGASLARVILESEHEVHDTYWPATVALFGFARAPVRAPISPDEVAGVAEHQVAYTPASLVSTLERAGFASVRVAAEDGCRHSGPWDEIIPDLCLRVCATV